MIKIIYTQQRMCILRLDSPELEDSLVEGNKLTGDNIYG